MINDLISLWPGSRSARVAVEDRSIFALNPDLVYALGRRGNELVRAAKTNDLPFRDFS